MAKAPRFLYRSKNSRCLKVEVPSNKSAEISGFLIKFHKSPMNCCSALITSFPSFSTPLFLMVKCNLFGNVLVNASIQLLFKKTMQVWIIYSLIQQTFASYGRLDKLLNLGFVQPSLIGLK
jgi:hypothetical protein